jgi:hypothetical protein
LRLAAWRAAGYFSVLYMPSPAPFFSLEIGRPTVLVTLPAKPLIECFRQPVAANRELIARIWGEESPAAQPQRPWFRPATQPRSQPTLP